MSSTKILNDLRKAIGEARGEDVEQIAAWERMLKKHELYKNWLKHPVSKQILLRLVDCIAQSNVKLSTERELTDVQRDGIFREKDIYLWFITLFTESEQAIAQIEADIKEKTEEFLQYNRSFLK